MKVYSQADDRATLGFADDQVMMSLIAVIE